MKYSEMLAQSVIPLDDTNVDEVGLFLEQNGMTDDQIDEYFLQHYGKKGMKWGQRKLTYQKIISARRTPTSNQLTRASQNTNRRIGTLGVGAVGIGAAYAARHFAKKNPKMSVVVGLSAASAIVANRLIKAHQNKKMSEISFTERSKP